MIEQQEQNQQLHRIGGPMKCLNTIITTNHNLCTRNRVHHNDNQFNNDTSNNTTIDHHHQQQQQQHHEHIYENRGKRFKVSEYNNNNNHHNIPKHHHQYVPIPHHQQQHRRDVKQQWYPQFVTFDSIINTLSYPFGSKMSSQHVEHSNVETSSKTINVVVNDTNNIETLNNNKYHGETNEIPNVDHSTTSTTTTSAGIGNHHHLHHDCHTAQISSKIIQPIGNVFGTITDTIGSFIPPIHHIIQYQYLLYNNNKQQHSQPQHNNTTTKSHENDDHGSIRHPSNITSSYHDKQNVFTSATTTTSSSSNNHPLRPSLQTRLINSFRIEIMHEQSEYHRSIYPILTFLYQCIIRWYEQLRTILLQIPIYLWHLCIIMSIFLPIVTFIVIPISIIIYQYGIRLYHNIVIPTPERVIEMIHWVYGIIHRWWIKFVGIHQSISFYNTDTDIDNNNNKSSSLRKSYTNHQNNIKIRRRTALAVSIAAKASGIGNSNNDNKRKRT